MIVTEGISEGIQMILAAPSLRKATKSFFQDQHIHPTFHTQNSSRAPQLPTKPLRRKAGVPNIDDLRSKISPKTRAIVITNPNNPTGSVYERKMIKEMIDIAGEHNLPVLSGRNLRSVNLRETIRQRRTLS